MKKRNTLIDEIRQINSNEKVVLTFGKKIESKFPKKRKEFQNWVTLWKRNFSLLLF